MRFTLGNLMAFTTIIALSIALFVSLNRTRSVIISEYDEYGFSDLFYQAGPAISESKWPDKTLPPPIPPQLVYAVSKSILGELESARDRTGYGLWEIKEISLVPLIEGDEWLYLVCLRGTDRPTHHHPGVYSIFDVRILILMNGSVITEETEYMREIESAVAGHSEVRFVRKRTTDTSLPVIDDPNDPFAN